MNTGSRMIHCGNICKASLRVFCRMVLCHRVSLCILVSLSLFSKGSQQSEHNKSINVDSPSVFSFIHPDWELMYGSCDSHRLTLSLKTYPKFAEDYSWMARLPTTTPPNKNSVLHTEIATSPVSWMFTIKPMTETLTSSGISNVLAFFSKELGSMIAVAAHQWCIIAQIMCQGFATIHLSHWRWGMFFWGKIWGRRSCFHLERDIK